ncbi:hypothetical protein [Streptomyces sp. SID12501]|uniref:Uncharacterized protein n=1 Tax=Streptomyces sp. SID12501 TaxID=2706042 RepID=A0A6B3BZQ5_9ACTN|nr:hypothetical protein [Streptomyces sp. SID12501]NEC89848.1 hypothetical protein [Streptomyces sp. SID12501]
MSDVEKGVCGAVTQLPPEFVKTERRVTGTDWADVTVACAASAHPGPEQVGPLVLHGERHGVHYWTANTP